MQYLAPLGSSDHVGILWQLKYGCKEQSRSRNIKRAYWEVTTIIWQTSLHLLTGKRNWETRTLMNAGRVSGDNISKQRPFVYYVGTRRKKKSHFISKDTIKLIKERNHLFKLFVQMLYEVNKMIKTDKAKETLKLVANLKSKRAFYGYVRSKQVVRTQNYTTS